MCLKGKPNDSLTSSSVKFIAAVVTSKVDKNGLGLLWFMLVADIDPSLCHGAYNNITQMCQIHFPSQYVLNP